MAARYVPDMGELVWLDFGAPVGHEQAGHRPALVLSPQSYNRKTRLLVCVPVSKQSKGYPSEVALPPGPITGVVLSDRVNSVDWAKRKVKKGSKANPAVVGAVKRKIKLLLQIP